MSREKIPGQRESYHGFTLYRFKFNELAAIVVEPQKAVQNNDNGFGKSCTDY